jgi:hypothetical protein
MGLATRAEVSRPRSNGNSFNGRATCAARLILLSVDPKTTEVFAGLSVRQQIRKVLEGGATSVESCFQNNTDR